MADRGMNEGVGFKFGHRPDTTGTRTGHDCGKDDVEIAWVMGMYTGIWGVVYLVSDMHLAWKTSDAARL